MHLEAAFTDSQVNLQHDGCDNLITIICTTILRGTLYFDTTCRDIRTGNVFKKLKPAMVKLSSEEPLKSIKLAFQYSAENTIKAGEVRTPCHTSPCLHC